MFLITPFKELPGIIGIPFSLQNHSLVCPLLSCSLSPIINKGVLFTSLQTNFPVFVPNFLSLLSTTSLLSLRETKLYGYCFTFTGSFKLILFSLKLLFLLSLFFISSSLILFINSKFLPFRL